MIQIDHADTVQVTGADMVPLANVLTQIVTILQDIQARVASLADQQAPPQEGSPA